MRKISSEESLLLQCIATASLLGELSNSGFLESDYYKRLPFENEGLKMVLTTSGLGNPATMQMMLYALLTIPREVLSRTAYCALETYIERINPLVYSLVEEETFSTYAGEEARVNIDYFRHIRNAIAHSKCDYLCKDGKNYVVFSDSNSSGSRCSIKMECFKVGFVMMELQRLILEYYNHTHKN